MLELLALPGWNVGPTPLTAWVDLLTNEGLNVVVKRESPGVSWLEIESLGLEGYAVMDGLDVEAINFELEGNDPATTRALLERVAEALSWEIHEDDDEDDDD